MPAVYISVQTQYISVLETTFYVTHRNEISPDNRAKLIYIDPEGIIWFASQLLRCSLSCATSFHSPRLINISEPGSISKINVVVPDWSLRATIFWKNESFAVYGGVLIVRMKRFVIQ